MIRFYCRDLPGLSWRLRFRTGLHQLTFSIIHNRDDSAAKNLSHQNTSSSKLYGMVPGARDLTNTHGSFSKGSSTQTNQTQEGPSFLLLALNS